MGVRESNDLDLENGACKGESELNFASQWIILFEKRPVETCRKCRFGLDRCA